MVVITWQRSWHKSNESCNQECSSTSVVCKCLGINHVTPHIAGNCLHTNQELTLYPIHHFTGPIKSEGSFFGDFFMFSSCFMSCLVLYPEKEESYFINMIEFFVNSY